MLESQTAFLAAQRVTPENIEAIEETLRGMEASIGQPEKYLEYDLQFHLTIARATQNSILYSLLSMIRGYLQEWIKGSLVEPSTTQTETRAKLSLLEHQKIRCPPKGRGGSAQQAMTEHILSSSVDLQGDKRIIFDKEFQKCYNSFCWSSVSEIPPQRWKNE